MTAIAIVLSRASGTPADVETLKTIAMFSGVGLDRVSAAGVLRPGSQSGLFLRRRGHFRMRSTWHSGLVAVCRTRRTELRPEAGRPENRCSRVSRGCGKAPCRAGQANGMPSQGRRREGAAARPDGGTSLNAWKTAQIRRPRPLISNGPSRPVRDPCNRHAEAPVLWRRPSGSDIERASPRAAPVARPCASLPIIASISRDHEIGRGVLHHVADIRQHDQSGIRHRLGERPRMNVGRYGLVDVAGDHHHRRPDIAVARRLLGDRRLQRHQIAGIGEEFARTQQQRRRGIADEIVRHDLRQEHAARAGLGQEDSRAAA